LCVVFAAAWLGVVVLFGMYFMFMQSEKFAGRHRIQWLAGFRVKWQRGREQEKKGKGVQTQPISLMPRQLFRPFNPLPISALISLPSAGNLCISSAIVRFWYLQYIIAVR